MGKRYFKKAPVGCSSGGLGRFLGLGGGGGVRDLAMRKCTITSPPKKILTKKKS